MEGAQRNGKAAGKPIVLILHAQTIPPLKELDEEAANLREALLGSDICEPHILPSANLERIFTELRERGDRIIAIHYAGHANGNGIMLQQSGGAGIGEKLAHISGIASALTPLKKLKLVFLNGCETEDQVPHFINAGIPAVIATHVKIGDRVATNFATEFYKCLASGHDVDRSFNQAASLIQADKGESCRGAYSEASEVSDSDLNRWPWELHGAGGGSGWKLADSASAEEDARLAGEGIAAFKSLLDDPAIRVKVEAIRAEITETRDHLRVISAYKELHDLLHDLQTGCVKHLMNGAACSDADKVQWDDIELAQEMICVELEKREGVAASAHIPEADAAWLSKLHKLADDIEQAVMDEDLKLLQSRARKVSSLVANCLAKMNTRLNEKARNLHLAPLIDGLSGIASSVDGGEGKAEDVDHFLQGLGALKRRKEKMEKLVKEHDAWQEVEDEMRLLNESVTGDDLDDLKMDWDERKCQVQGLYESPDTPWVVRTEKYARKLDEAIEGDLESKMKSAFEAYYRQTRLRFVKVDKDLKDLTQEMRSIGDGLSDVLAKLTS
jgi:hypothetical protein